MSKNFTTTSNSEKLLICAIIAISFVLYGNSLRGTYTLDDNAVINNREVLENVYEFPKIFISTWHPNEPWIGTYRPLTLLSFALNNVVFSKDNFFGFHFVNILLHTLNTIMIFFVVSQFASRRTAYLSVLFFVFLPIHSEPISSIVGRKELLGLFFVLLSILWFFKKKYIASSFALLLALLANELSISLLLIIGVLSLVETKSFVKSLKLSLWYLPSLPIYFMLRYATLGQYAFGNGFVDSVFNPLVFVSAKERIFTAFSHLFLYIKKTFYPVNLSPDYSFNQIPTVHNIFSSYQALLGLLFLVGLIALFIRSKKDLKIALIFFLAPYVVISNIFFNATGTIAERWWYFPSFGIAVLVGLAFDSILNRYGKLKPCLYGLGIILLIWYSSLTIKQNRIWLNNRNLFIHAAKASPNSVVTRSNLAALYIDDDELKKAREEVEFALAIYGEYPASLNILGKLNWKDSRYQEAESDFTFALQNDKNGRNHRSLLRSLAFLKIEEKDNKKALWYMEEALRWPPARDNKKIEQIDAMLYKKIQSYQNRNTNSYTQAESQELTSLIKSVRGF